MCTDDQTPAIPAANFVAANNLVRAGLTLDVLLPENDTIAEQLAGLAYLGTSAQHRDEPVAAGERTKAIGLAVGDLMEEVTVSGPAFVTMSSEDGPFQVTIRNGLDQPVTVAVRANAIGTDRLRIPSPEPITLEPGQRHPFRMHANSSTVGIWPVVLQPVNVDGTPLGASIEMKRAQQPRRPVHLGDPRRRHPPAVRADRVPRFAARCGPASRPTVRS